jgi:hypothetical protein
MNRAIWMLTVSALLLGSGSVPLNGAPIRVGVISGTDSGGGPQAVVNMLSGLHEFSAVDQLSNNASLATLQQYDAILFYTNSGGDLSGTGNTLHAYVSQGGGLVVSTFLWQASNLGQLTSDSPFVGQGSNSYSNVTLGTYDATNPIMSGVASLGGHYHDDVALASGATLVASWSDSRPLVAVSTNGIVGVNLFPSDYYGSMSGDYAKLFGNALEYAGGGLSSAPSPAPAPSGLTLSVLGAVTFAGYLGWRRRKQSVLA